jgi:hypothetical protein
MAQSYQPDFGGNPDDPFARDADGKLVRPAPLNRGDNLEDGKPGRVEEGDQTLSARLGVHMGEKR